MSSMIPWAWLKKEKGVRGRDRIRQRVKEWGSLLGGARSVRA